MSPETTMRPTVSAIKPAIFLILIAIAVVGHTQTPLAIGEWQTYPGIERFVDVEQSEKYIYYQLKSAVLQVDKVDKSWEFISKNNGLSQADVRRIEYSPFEDLLIVAYENSGVDLVYEDRVFYINEIVDNANIAGSRRINDIYIANKEVIYLACDFGLVEYRIDNQEFGFTCFTDVPIQSTIVYEGRLLAGSEDGIYLAPMDGSVNLSDFTAYDTLGQDNNLPEIYEALELVTFGGSLYAHIDQEIYTSQDLDSFELFLNPQGYRLEYIDATPENMAIGYRCDGGCPNRVYFTDKEGNIRQHNGGVCAVSPRMATIDQYGVRWYADNRGQIRYQTPGENDCRLVEVNSPHDDVSFEITVKDDNVYIAGGTASEIFFFGYSNDGWYQMDPERQWTNVNLLNNDFFHDRSIQDILYIRPDPIDDNTVYLATNGHGLLRYRGPEDIFVFDNTNSTLRGTSGTEDLERVSGAAFDNQGQLWLSNYLAQDALSVLRRDTTWQSFTLPTTLLSRLAVDNADNKWILEVGSGGGVIVFNEGEPDNPNDDMIRRISASNSELESNFTLSIAVDRDGLVWVGTDQGAVVFNCPDPFNTDFNCLQGFRPRVEVDGFLAFLLSSERVNAIAVDGADRKWFGTDNGVFVMSPDGQEQIHHFTTSNSPLPSDRVIGLAINPNNGEAFIGTELGLVSYRSQATQGSVNHRSDLKVFPNPVRPEYEGMIAIEGLAEDAFVKITDASGNLVSELLATGGQAVWDGLDLEGNRVATGVYLVFSTTLTTFTRPDAASAKILILR